MAKPHIVAAIRTETHARIYSEGVPLAIKTLREVMVDKENAPASARVTAAKAVFDIAGVGRDVGRDVKGDLSDDLRSKPLHERTTEELQEVVDKARITLANTPRLIAPTPDDEIH